MRFEDTAGVSLKKARQEYLHLLTENGFGFRTEEIAASQAYGRITTQAVYAKACVPSCAASARDGIALRAEETVGASEEKSVMLRPEQYCFVRTGDAVPAGYDAVIMDEDIRKKEDGTMEIVEEAVHWQYIRQIGEDICAGDMLVPSYTEVTSAMLGAMLVSGIETVEVIAKPVIGFLSEGNGVNTAIFSSMIQQWGAEVSVYEKVPETFEQYKEQVEKAACECDVVLLNTKVGEENNCGKVIQETGKILYQGIAMKPGKLAVLGYRNEVPILGIPDYPVAGMMVLEEFIKPLIQEWMKGTGQIRHYVKATLTRGVTSKKGYEEFIRVRMGYVENRLMATPLSGGSSVISSYMKADGILEIPGGCEKYDGGAEVKIRLISKPEKLRHTLVGIGSHDPLLDELADLLHREWPSMYLSSSHVGSMGGIMAVRRGEAHVAGCHLLDTRTGEYNRSFLRKYFPQGGVKLIRCVGRQQGLMVQKGNPLNIEKFADISNASVRYVNRQKGSGTRILMDYLCEKEGMDVSVINGYDREEMTHTRVAAQIAMGSADAGLGIYSAAKLYELEFLPLCTEEYDLIVSEKSWESPMVQNLLTILKSDEFRERLQALGGYILEAPGEEILF